MIDITTIETTDLGDRSYLVSDGSVAIAIDVQRDFDRVLAVATAKGVTITHVFETHVHNDYVTGGFELAGRTGALYCVSAADDVAFDRLPLHDGDRIVTGSLTIEVIHTPGHTPTHLSFAVHPRPVRSVDHPTVPTQDPVAVFSGGSLLYGTVGRTDLIGSETTESLTRQQFRSARRLASLPDTTELFPTHGFGSFCSSASTSGAHASTIGHERRTNLALIVDDEDAFVRDLLEGLTAYPRYYSHMAPLNRSGPEPIDLSPPATVDAAEVRRRIEAGEWVVDLRSRKAFARNHMEGTIGIEVGDSFITYLGWIIPWGTPVTLVADTAEEIAAAQRSMVRIGIDRPAGSATGGPAAWSDGRNGSFLDADFHELATALVTGDPVVLDVRRSDEWALSHIPGSINIPLHELPDRLDEVPDDVIWVHCESAYRAAIGASLLARAGRSVVFVDDDFSNAATAGIPIGQDGVAVYGGVR